MNARQYMIVDLERRGNKKMFVTEQVSSIDDNKNGFWSVRFSSSSRVFNYNTERLLCLTNPEVVELGEKGLYMKNRRVSDVAELFCFTNGRYTFYHVIYTNGYYDDFEGNDVYVTRTSIDKIGGSIWDYLKKLAEETGLISEDEDNILSKQYELVDVKRDNVPLAQYIGDKTHLSTYQTPNHIYFPFGCNASQKKAVEAALTNQVSIIQGPPGTGKTQTILNVIANLLVAGKSVLVVSNNNSAVENIEEKLTNEGFGFIVAKLGSIENKKAFVANQKGYSDMTNWLLESPLLAKEKFTKAINIVSQGFDQQTYLAQLKKEYDAILKEAKYNDMLQREITDYEWLYNKSSAQLMKFLNSYRMIVEKGQRPNLWFRLKWVFSLGFNILSFFTHKSSVVIATLEAAYYVSRKAEIEKELQTITSTLQLIDIEQSIKDLTLTSLQILKHEVAKRYETGKRKQFTSIDIKLHAEEFLKEYPVVLSTAYSAKSCVSRDMVFDYVIMDEASQVDIKTGALALSCAMNAVVVGDDKQLPNVVSRDERAVLNLIQSIYKVEDKYNAVTHSFLQSCVEVFREVPITLLREHYRCHPKIIEFCNQRFYNGELVTMTLDNNESKVLHVIRTVPGNHARGHLNQREIDVIVQEVMSEYTGMGSVGIITPYRMQAAEINKAIGRDIASTVHKYQGRECDTIIMSTVDNSPTEFSDDANLLNVAISRAKAHLCIVTSGNEMPQETILAQLIAYVQYNNFEVKNSKLHSVFDLLYKQYTSERLAYELTHPTVSEYLSENLIYDILVKAISELNMTNTEVLCHYPMSRLIVDLDELDLKERAFVESPFSHVDFLIYNSLTKLPLHTIEVDGWRYHKESNVQHSRDVLKDQILNKIGLCSHRILTTDIVTVESIKNMIIGI